jgi:hypothetical protein
MNMSALKNSPAFWQGAFLFALALLIFAHKITIEGMIGGE